MGFLGDALGKPFEAVPVLGGDEFLDDGWLQAFFGRLCGMLFSPPELA